jgi:hypothetical protein
LHKRANLADLVLALGKKVFHLVGLGRYESDSVTKEKNIQS